MYEPKELLLNHCPRALSTLYAYEKAHGRTVDDTDLDRLLIRLLRKAEMYSRMEKGERI